MKKLLSCLAMLATLLAPATFAREHGHQCSPDGVGIGGYDLVSYHTTEGPKPGSPGFVAEYGGLTYRFVSAANRDRFVAAPQDYLPRYSGFCAATLSMGRLACPDYTNFKIEDGELLLFELAGFTNGRTLWNADPASFRERADNHARTLLTP